MKRPAFRNVMEKVGAWIRGGWHVAIAYVLGFLAMLLIIGWHPHTPPKAGAAAPPAAERSNH